MANGSCLLVDRMFFSKTFYALFALSALSASSWAAKPNSVVILFGDGMGLGMINFKLEYDKQVRKKDSGVLRKFLEDSQISLVQTAAHDFLVTDSAAGATALFCGLKTNHYFCGITPDGKPCLTVAEIAKKKGKALGFVTTDEVLDATPAALFSHGMRRDKATLAKELIKTRPHFIAGGGRKSFSVKFAKDNGYQVVENAGDLDKKNLRSKDTAVLLADEFLPFPSQDPAVPHLKDLTRAALKSLEKAPKGFFLLLENEWSDAAGHENSPQFTLEAMDELEGALEVLVPLAKAGKFKLFMVSDHDTGGMAMAPTVSILKDLRFPIAQDLAGLKKIFWITPDHTNLPIALAIYPRPKKNVLSLLDNTQVFKILVESL